MGCIGPAGQQQFPLMIIIYKIHLPTLQSQASPTGTQLHVKTIPLRHPVVQLTIHFINIYMHEQGWIQDFLKGGQNNYRGGL